MVTHGLMKFSQPGSAIADFGKLWLYNHGHTYFDRTTVNQGQLWQTLVNYGYITMGTHGWNYSQLGSDMAGVG